VVYNTMSCPQGTLVRCTCGQHIQSVPSHLLFLTLDQYPHRHEGQAAKCVLPRCIFRQHCWHNNSPPHSSTKQYTKRRRG
jgi:hypothetical protein